MEYQRDEHRVHLIVYHLIWCPKRRKPVLVGEVAKDLRSPSRQNYDHPLSPFPTWVVKPGRLTELGKRQALQRGAFQPLAHLPQEGRVALRKVVLPLGGLPVGWHHLTRPQPGCRPAGVRSVVQDGENPQAEWNTAARYPKYRRAFRTTIWKNTGIRKSGSTLLLARAGLAPLTVAVPAAWETCRVLEARLVFDKKPTSTLGTWCSKTVWPRQSHRETGCWR